MTWVVVIEKTGKVNEKNHMGDCAQLYKKCGFRKPDGFAMRHAWKVRVGDEVVFAQLWAKDDGRAGHENKFELPPPVDTTLFFGTMCVVLVDDADSPIPGMDLRKKSWTKVYEALYGGFEDLGNDDDDDEEEDELADVPPSMKTKAGYLKDGFVVDSAGNSDEDGDDESSDDDDDGGDDADVVDGDDSDDAGGLDADDGDGDVAAEVDAFSECSEEEYEYSDD